MARLHIRALIVHALHIHVLATGIRATETENHSSATKSLLQIISLVVIIRYILTILSTTVATVCYLNLAGAHLPRSGFVRIRSKSVRAVPRNTIHVILTESALVNSLDL